MDLCVMGPGQIGIFKSMGEGPARGALPPGVLSLPPPGPCCGLEAWPSRRGHQLQGKWVPFPFETPYPQCTVVHPCLLTLAGSLANVFS